MLASKHPDEDARLAALRRYQILDTEYEKVFDDLTRLASELLDVPVSLISLVDGDRQWFKSEVGLGLAQTSLDVSICAHAILESEVFVVPDALRDYRFAENPLVAGGPQFRFYAGARLNSSDGYPLGMLCVLDNKPREFSDSQKNILQVLAREVMTHMELRVRARELERTTAELRERDERFQVLARATKDAVWDWDLRTDGVIWNEALQIGFGYQPAEVRDDAAWWYEHIHPEDRDFIVHDIHEVINGRGDGHSWTGNYRFTRADGSYADILDRGYVIRNEQGEALRMIGAMQDVSERNRLLREARENEAREHLINEIGDAIRSTLDPEVMQATLVERLGVALHTDYCFVTTVDMVHDKFRIGKDYRANTDMATLAGTYRLSDVAVSMEEMYAGRKTLVVTDTEQLLEKGWQPQTIGVLQRMGLRALVNVPLYEEGKLVGALGVAMSCVPREWTTSEITLIKIIAAQARSAIELARNYRRDRTIASQLQETLIPPRPPKLPGLILAGHYQPALEEAGVGGDFWDVFTLNDDCTMLVVGDLSGKGLDAASQVATVRNMLRYAVYSSPNIADAVTSLNTILAQQDLLTGFATLFVGCYDHAQKTLSYVNCGQEPGLVWRQADSEVEMLGPTGAVLGGFASLDTFDQETVTLHPGDAFALFTDGMTEVGPTRKQFLEVTGVRALFQEYMAKEQETGGASGELGAERVVSALIRGVDSYAGTGGRDDIALLVGVMQG